MSDKDYRLTTTRDTVILTWAAPNQHDKDNRDAAVIHGHLAAALTALVRAIVAGAR